MQDAVVVRGLIVRWVESEPGLEVVAALRSGREAIAQIERLEQLRLLENGISIYVGEAEGDTIGVDTEDDLQRVEAILRGKPSESILPAA